MLNQTVHFGGTIAAPRRTQWHDLLAKAAAPKPEEKKKDDSTDCSQEVAPRYSPGDRAPAFDGYGRV
jgi:hypothetical protein